MPDIAVKYVFRRALLLLALAALVAPLLPGCSGDPGSGPKAVKWDRTSCERCRMVLSDRKHSAQVRVGADTGKSKVYFFDDIGCAVIWLDDKPFRDAPSTEIWVTDWRSGDWIDARRATYIDGHITPMGYGLGAQPESAGNGLDFTQAKTHIFEVEKRFNQHAAHLMQTLREKQRADTPASR